MKVQIIIVKTNTIRRIVGVFQNYNDAEDHINDRRKLGLGTDGSYAIQEWDVQ